MFRIEKELQELKKSFRQMEIYTGLQTQHNVIENDMSESLPGEKELS